MPDTTSQQDTTAQTPRPRPPLRVISGEIDAHHHAPGAGAAYLGEAGLGEDLPASDIQLTPDDLLAGMGDHRVGLKGPGAILPCEVDRGRGQRVADAALAVSLAGHEAGNRPDAGVRLVLVATAPDGPDPGQSRVRRARLDRHPASRLRSEVGHEPGGAARPRVITVGLLTEPGATAGVVHRAPVAVWDLEVLAVALAGLAGRPEDGLQVCPRGLVGGNDGQLRRGHRASRRGVIAVHGGHGNPGSGRSASGTAVAAVIGRGTPLPPEMKSSSPATIRVGLM